MASALAELIVMGGAVLTHGNITEVATANLYNDPEAAAIVYQSGAPVVQVGMDVCQKVAIPEAHLERFQHTPTPLAQLLTRITPTLVKSYMLSVVSDGWAPGYITTTYRRWRTPLTRACTRRGSITCALRRTMP